MWHFSEFIFKLQNITFIIIILLNFITNPSELKLNLKFEIEVLCKHLTIEISELRPGNVLKDYQRFEKFLNFKVGFR